MNRLYNVHSRMGLPCGKCVLLLVLICALCASGFSACGPEDSAAPDSDGVTRRVSAINPPGEFPIAKEPVVLRVATLADEYVEDYATNTFTQFYEEKTNIHVEWDFIPKITLEEQTRARLASNDLPDVFLKCYITDASVLYYGSKGVLRPLGDLIETYAPNTQRAMEKAPYMLDSTVTPDGNIYHVPNIGEVLHTTMPKKAWIYNPWLKTLDIPLPQTTEELYQTLIAFRDLDPNGNGLADEILFAGATGTHNEIESYLLQSFLFYDRSNYLSMEDGKVVFSPATDAYREGVAYIRRLMTEGLIMPDSFTQDRIALTSYVENEEGNRLGVATAIRWAHFTNTSGERHKDFTALPVLKGPDRAAYGYDRGYGPTIGSDIGTFVITRACALPEAAMRWMDELYDQTALLSWDIHPTMGVEGVDWTRNPLRVEGLDGQPADYELILPFGAQQNVHWSQTINSYSSYAYRMRGAATDETETRLFRATAALYKPFSAQGRQVPFVFLTETQNARLNDLRTAIHSVVQLYLVQFTTGSLDMDTGWSLYLDELENAGVQEYVRLV
ncbi:extracellular solute-binding protein, partial [Ruminococcaceae bacterium OttesenSCG-928-L11]|nr:extracellular solute-binding protein [Ruminococcaceae bacterium OttesenSCG-928-L11]